MEKKSLTEQIAHVQSLAQEQHSELTGQLRAKATSLEEEEKRGREGREGRGRLEGEVERLAREAESKGVALSALERKMEEVCVCCVCCVCV